MHWHLHITVLPHRSWTHADLAEALACDVARHGIKPLVITNHLKDGRFYKELIPTKEIEAGNESQASAEIFRMGVLLNNRGWRIRRLKIEGDPRQPGVAQRALYFETHLKNAQLPCNAAAPFSTTAKGDHYHTVRRSTIDAVYNTIDAISMAHYGVLGSWPVYNQVIELEAAVLDTNPQLDNEWINQ